VNVAVVGLCRYSRRLQQLQRDSMQAHQAQTSAVDLGKLLQEKTHPVATGALGGVFVVKT
jgi:hypothetical protein